MGLVLFNFPIDGLNKLCNKLYNDDTKKLCHGCNQIFESFSSKHVMGFLSSCLVMIYFINIDFTKSKDQPTCIRLVATARLFVW